MITSYNKLYLKAPSELQHKSQSHRRTKKNIHPPQTRWIEIYLLEFKRKKYQNHRKTRDSIPPKNKQLLMNNPIPDWQSASSYTGCHLSQCCTAGCVHEQPSKIYCIFNMCFKPTICVHTTVEHTGPMMANTHLMVKEENMLWLTNENKTEHRIRTTFLP